MIILIIHDIGILANEFECNAPVSAYRDGPSAFSIALKRMKIQTWKLHIFWRCGCVKLSQNKPQSLSVFCLNSRLGTGLEESGQALVFEATDHR